jgi:hypothetical protein
MTVRCRGKAWAICNSEMHCGCSDASIGDLVDEHIRMGESTCLESMYRFCRGIVQVFGEHYLRGPNEADTNWLMATNSATGLPGMLGSIDCMHWEWKNCPFAWQGQ